MAKELLLKQLTKFSESFPMNSKGALSLALVITDHARTKGLPLDANALVTKGKGQVIGLGKGHVQAILNRHGISQVLAQEAGRTSRGSLGHMQAYVDFLNGLHESGLADLGVIEDWWAEKVREYFKRKPLILSSDPGKSLRSSLKQMLLAVQKREKENPGSTFLGTILQHLAGAKLELMGNAKVEHNAASAADESTGREADFLVGDTAIHVTSSPSESLISKCADNLDKGHKPLILTLSENVGPAQYLADRKGLADRIEVMDIEQFIAGNIHEKGQWGNEGRRLITAQLVDKYNEIVSMHETDPGLHIELK